MFFFRISILNVVQVILISLAVRSSSISKGVSCRISILNVVQAYGSDVIFLRFDRHVAPLGLRVLRTVFL